MTSHNARALSQVLDQLEETVDGDEVAVGEMVDHMGDHAFASVMLIFALISTSPASAIPGVTAIVAVIEFTLVAQIVARRQSLWLPSFILRQRLSSSKLCRGIQWLRKPIGFVERFFKPRLTFLLHPPWVYVPLVLILLLTPLMPLMEVIPTSGSIASAVIAFFAASMLTRDGVLAVCSMLLLAVIPFVVWQFGFSG